jgi:hypothetical protein
MEHYLQEEKALPIRRHSRTSVTLTEDLLRRQFPWAKLHSVGCFEYSTILQNAQKDMDGWMDGWMEEGRVQAAGGLSCKRVERYG